MNKYEKLFKTILTGTSDSNISFNDLCKLLFRVGFEERVKGSHHIFRKDDVEERINLQKDGNKAKSYQVRQIRVLITKYRLSLK
jgi:predicted RNA binding protein YcfA (HicA-like mRNA interferase family)